MSTPPTPHPAIPAPTGRLSWALGFLAYLPVPFLSLLIASAAVMISSSSRRRSPDPLVRGNATNAANWALTVFVVVALCVVYFSITMSVEQFRTGGFFPIGAVLIVLLALSAAHLAVTIAGTAAAATRVYRAPIAIPFLRD